MEPDVVIRYWVCHGRQKPRRECGPSTIELNRRVCYFQDKGKNTVTGLGVGKLPENGPVELGPGRQVVWESSALMPEHHARFQLKVSHELKAAECSAVVVEYTHFHQLEENSQRHMYVAIKHPGKAFADLRPTIEIRWNNRTPGKLKEEKEGSSSLLYVNVPGFVSWFFLRALKRARSPVSLQGAHNAGADGRKVNPA